MSFAYDQYLKEHCENVKNALEWMKENLPTVIDGFTMEDALSNVEHHDESKYSKDEYPAYDAYFYGGNKSYDVVQEFNVAWLKHIHNNPHHWQYWVLYNDDPLEGIRALDMPLVYIYEMIADWWSFSWRSGNLTEIFKWYEEHSGYIMLSTRTRLIVEDILEAMGKVLMRQLIMEQNAGVKNDVPYISSNEDDGFGHSGVPGMKWGVRNYQNKDGTWTELGKERRREQKTVFVSGSSKTQDPKGKYYHKDLPDLIKKELNKHMDNGDRILVGDAPGIDRQVQDYLNKAGYSDVEIYGPGKEVRYAANDEWITHPIDAPEFEEGSKEWLAKKDKAMSDAADEGLAVILGEGGSRATRNNAMRLVEDNKHVRLLELYKNGEVMDPTETTDPDTVKEYLELLNLEDADK